MTFNVELTADAVDVTTSMTPGSSYNVQNVGDKHVDVAYLESPDTNFPHPQPKPHILPPRHLTGVQVSTGKAWFFWVPGVGDGAVSTLAITEAP